MKKKIISAVMVSMLALMPMMTNVNAEQEALYATKIAPKTVAASLEGLKVTRSSAPVNDAVATGDIIEKDGKEYIAVVCGDVNGDADINSTDFMKIRYAYLELRSLDEVSQMAADVNFDEKINSTDFLRIRRHFLGVFNLCNDGEIDFGKGTSASIGNRPTLYFSKDDTEYYSPLTINLFGDIEFINNYSMVSTATDEDKNLIGTTKDFNFEGTDYMLTYKKNVKWDDFEEELQRYDGNGCSVTYNEKTGEVIRVWANYDEINVRNTSEQELKTTALGLLSKYTGFVFDETYKYTCITYYDTYIKNDDGIGYTSRFTGYSGYYEPEERLDEAETYDVIDSFDIKFAQYVNGIKTDNRALVRFYGDYVDIVNYDIDFDSISIDNEEVINDFDMLLANRADDIFVNGEYEMCEPQAYRRDGHVYVRVYCKGELQTSTEEWPLTGTYFVLDYGEG